MHSIKYLFGILILHFIYITITRSHVGEIRQSHTTYVSHVLQQITTWGGGGGGDYLPTTEKKNSHKDNNKN